MVHQQTLHLYQYCICFHLSDIFACQLPIPNHLPVVRTLLAPAAAAAASTAPAPGQVGGGCVDVRGGGARRDEVVGVAGHGPQLGQGGGGGRRRRSARTARGVLALLRGGSSSINSL